MTKWTGDGTAANATITSVDIIGPGTIFDGNNLDDFGNGSYAGFGYPAFYDASTLNDIDTVDPDGILDFVTLDITGFLDGEEFTLYFDEPDFGNPGNPPLSSDLADSPDVTAQFIPGTIRTAVPEPAIALILGGSMLFVLRRRLK